MENTQHAGLIVASNRLPFTLTRKANGSFQVEPGSGGLITALLPVLVCAEGFLLSHTSEALDLPGRDAVDAFLAYRYPEAAARSQPAEEEAET